MWSRVPARQAGAETTDQGLEFLRQGVRSQFSSLYGVSYQRRPWPISETLPRASWEYRDTSEVNAPASERAPSIPEGTVAIAAAGSIEARAIAAVALLDTMCRARQRVRAWPTQTLLQGRP